MNQKLTLNDGTVLESSYAIRDGSNLWVYVYAAISFGELFLLLNDPEKVKKITAERDGAESVHRGYKELFCIRKENGGFISAGLRK